MVPLIIDLVVAIPVAGTLIVLSVALGAGALLVYRRDNAPRVRVRQGHSPSSTPVQTEVR